MIEITLRVQDVICVLELIVFFGMLFVTLIWVK